MRGDSDRIRRKRLGVRAPGLALVLVALASCARQVPPPASPPVAMPDDAVHAGVTAGPRVEGLDEAVAQRARAAFLASCPVLLRREDASGLTRPEDWQPACAAAAAPGPAAKFFQDRFEAVRIGEGKAFVTGYYEPEIEGSRVPIPGYEVPVYAKPDDLVDADPAAVAAGAPRRGRLENGVVVPYYDRAEIEDGALAGRGLEIAWAKDPVALFFLEIQGSGRLRLPDGGVMRIGYAGQNGRDYVGIGRLMRERGLVEPGHTTMQDLVAWLHDHPDEGRALMRENKSYVFFRELTGAGPLGALGVAVTPRGTVAADPKFVPLGAPVLLDLDRTEASGLWVAQDTGGAIRGRNRFDTFWGAGEEAARIAGGMQGSGTALILVPKGTLARLRATPQR
jgi:membrane-bound lytic murein transglycosylase A